MLGRTRTRPSQRPATSRAKSLKVSYMAHRRSLSSANFQAKPPKVTAAHIPPSSMYLSMSSGVEGASVLQALVDRDWLGIVVERQSRQVLGVDLGQLRQRVFHDGEREAAVDLLEEPIRLGIVPEREVVA